MAERRSNGAGRLGSVASSNGIKMAPATEDFDNRGEKEKFRVDRNEDDGDYVEG